MEGVLYSALACLSMLVRMAYQQPQRKMIQNDPYL
jgi:hypothetical protein